MTCDRRSWTTAVPHLESRLSQYARPHEGHHRKGHTVRISNRRGLAITRAIYLKGTTYQFPVILADDDILDTRARLDADEVQYAVRHAFNLLDGSGNPMPARWAVDYSRRIVGEIRALSVGQKVINGIVSVVPGMGEGPQS